MTDSKPEVAVIMGSASDWETMKHACDMLDRGIRPERVRLARFEEGDEGAEPVLSGKRRDFVAKRLIRLIDECAGYGGNLDEMAHAAADATRALIELERA